MMKFFQIDLVERRSRRDMSPQGRKRVAGMVSRDYQTVSGASAQNSSQVSCNIIIRLMKIESNMNCKFVDKCTKT